MSPHKLDIYVKQLRASIHTLYSLLRYMFSLPSMLFNCNFPFVYFFFIFFLLCSVLYFIYHRSRHAGNWQSLARALEMRTRQSFNFINIQLCLRYPIHIYYEWGGLTHPLFLSIFVSIQGVYTVQSSRFQHPKTNWLCLFVHDGELKAPVRYWSMKMIFYGVSDQCHPQM